MGKFIGQVGLQYLWGKIKYYFVTALGTSGNYLTWTKNGTTNNITVPFATSALSLTPSQTKTYTGVLGTAEDWANATFFFASIKPTGYYDEWRIKYHIHVFVPGKNGYNQTAEVMISGDQSTMRAYSSMNTVATSCAYYHILYRAKSAGINNGYGHALGIRLLSSNNPITAGYGRTVEIELYEAYNCTVTFFDSCLKYANIPGTGSTNYDNYSELNFVSNGLQEIGDANDVNYQNRIYYTSSFAAEDIYRYQLLLRTKDNKLLPVSSANNVVGAANKTYSSGKFDPFGEIYYYNSTTTKAANAALGNDVLYRQVLVDARYAFDISASSTSKFDPRKPVYLTAILQSDGTAILTKPAGSTIGPLAQDLPSTADGLIYIFLGMAYEDSYPYRFELLLNHPVYYHDGDTVKILSEGNLLDNIKYTGGAFYSRPTGEGKISVDSDYAIIKSIKGNTLAWNQLLPPIDSSKWSVLNGTKSITDNIATYTVTTAVNDLPSQRIGVMGQLTRFPNHIYFYKVIIMTSINRDVYFGGAFYQGNISNIEANIWKTFKGEISYQTGAENVNYYFALANATVGETLKVKNTLLIDLTLMFGAGNEPTVEEFEAMFPLDYYAQDSGRLINFNGEELVSKDINNNTIGRIILNPATWTGKLNGEGESVTIFPDGMRGAGEAYDSIEKVDGQWYGVVNVGSVDLGTLDWQYRSDIETGRFASSSLIDYGAKPAIKTKCAKYISCINDHGYRYYGDKIIYLYYTTNNTNNIVYITDTAYTDAATFKTAMNGVMLNYELATPKRYLLDPIYQAYLNASYKIDQEGLECILPNNTSIPYTSPAIMDIQYGIDSDSVLENTLYKINTLEEVVLEDEEIVATSLVDLNNRLDTVQQDLEDDEQAIAGALTDLNNKVEDIQSINGDLSDVAFSGNYEDLEGTPNIPSWALNNNKPSYTLDEVTDGSTRKLSTYAPLASPALTGTPTAPTAATGTNTTQIATTAFVKNAIDGSKVIVVNANTLPSTLDPNKVYNLGTLTGTVTIPAFSSVDANDNEAKVWCFTFSTSTTAPTITWPAGITAWNGGSAPTINASKSYEVSVMNGIGVVIET